MPNKIIKAEKTRPMAVTFQMLKLSPAVQLMKLKQNAIGDVKVPLKCRCYMYITILAGDVQGWYFDLVCCVIDLGMVGWKSHGNCVSSQ